MISASSLRHGCWRVRDWANADGFRCDQGPLSPLRWATAPWIDQDLTTALASKISTNLFAKTGVGHTRANYSKDIPLYFDGESEGSEGANTLVRQMEKYNNFVFPTQGPRSF